MLKLRHKADAAQVHPQDGNAPGVGVLGGMEDGAVSAEADDAVKLFSQLCRQFRRVARPLGLTDGHQITRLAEAGHRAEQRRSGPGLARLGIDNE